MQSSNIFDAATVGDFAYVEKYIREGGDIDVKGK